MLEIFETNLINNIIDFTYELIELLKEDWIKFKKFVSENKRYIVIFIILCITMQFTDLLNICNSWEKYKEEHNIQTGGAAAAGAVAKAAPAVSAGAAAKSIGRIDGAAMYEAKKAGEKEAKDKQKEAKEKADEQDETKQIDKKLGFFNRFKNRIGKSFGRYGALGPVFGNLDVVFGYVKGMFILIGTILVLIGVMSLPVLIFLVLTYCVFKSLLGRFTNL
jgi:hypothetical protein